MEEDAQLLATVQVQRLTENRARYHTSSPYLHYADRTLVSHLECRLSVGRADDCLYAALRSAPLRKPPTPELFQRAPPTAAAYREPPQRVHG